MLSDDLRRTPEFQEVEAFYQAVRRPGEGRVSDALELSVASDGRAAVFSGVVVDRLEGALPTRICRVDMATGQVEALTAGPNVDRLARYAPDGGQVAFLSDREGAGDFQLYLLDPATGATRAAARLPGWIEYLHWSPDGRWILVGAASHGADVSGGQGAIPSKQGGVDLPSWMPIVETGDEGFRWRSAWVYEIGTDGWRQVSPAGTNVWEATWCGDDAFAAIVSPGPSEGLWYTATVALFGLDGENGRELFAPKDQLGWPAGSPSGRHIAVVEAVCSDRGIVIGDLRLIDVATGRTHEIDTAGVDIAHIEWRSDDVLLLAGHRGFETVVGLYDLRTRRFSETWKHDALTTGGRYVTVAGFGEAGDCTLIGESFTRAPEVALIEAGAYRAVHAFDIGYSNQAAALAAAEPVRWQAPDGLEIHGWLLRPQGEGLYPLIMNIHGGPVWHWRPSWLGRAAPTALMFLRRGYAVFLPNPRGSSGRGQDYTRRVKGDFGCGDAQDLVAGLKHLVEQRIADPDRIGVTGQSYGGFMTAWLVANDAPIQAAVTVAPHVNQVSEYLLSNIPEFLDVFLMDSYHSKGGAFIRSSPIMWAAYARAPTMNIAGKLDRCTPPSEAVQFHNALRLAGAPSALVIYGQEGHGIRSLPAAIDYTVRMLCWFETHLSGPEARSR